MDEVLRLYKLELQVLQELYDKPDKSADEKLVLSGAMMAMRRVIATFEANMHNMIMSCLPTG